LFFFLELLFIAVSEETAMKIFFLMLLLSFSSQAFSKHNWYEETCQFQSVKGEINLYKRNYWEGMHLIITSDFPELDHYDEVYLPGSEGSKDDSVKGDEVIVFSSVEDSNEVKQPYNDGCWQGFTKHFDRKVKVEQSADKIKEILDIKSGDELTMKCGYEHLEMLGDACDKL
jgi:hypothetical protein